METIPLTSTASDLTTRVRIRDAAMAEFSEKGYRSATMRGIAAAAGVSLGLVQHHFGTKDGLRQACDEHLLEVVRHKVEAVETEAIKEPHTMAALRSLAPAALGYAARMFLDDDSPGSNELFDQLMREVETWLTSGFTDRYVAGSPSTRDAAAVMIAMSFSSTLLQGHLARQMDVEPFSEAAVQRIGQASIELFEAIGDLVGSATWRAIRAGAGVYDGARQGGEPSDAGP